MGFDKIIDKPNIGRYMFYVDPDIKILKDKLRQKINRTYFLFLLWDKSKIEICGYYAVSIFGHVHGSGRNWGQKKPLIQFFF